MPGLYGQARRGARLQAALGLTVTAGATQRGGGGALGAPDLFAPAAPPVPAAPPPVAPRVDALRLMRGMAALPPFELARDATGQECCPPCGQRVDTARPFLAVGGFEYRDTDDGARERRRASILMHIPCHAAWWAARCAAAFAAGADPAGTP